MSKLSIEATILDLCKETGVRPIYEDEATDAPERADNSETGPLERAGYSLDDVNAYIATLTPAQRIQADLPATGPVYFITDDAAEAMGDEATRDQLKHNQSVRLGIFTLADFPGIYTPTANRYDTTTWQPVAYWPTHRVFQPGVKDVHVLGYVQERVAYNANTNPGQEFPGKKG